MAPYQNTRSSFRASQQVEDEQTNQNTRSRSSSQSSSHSESSSQVEDEPPCQNTPTPQVVEKQPCYLLHIHAEIRNEIYRLVLVSEDKIRVGVNDAPPMDPPLLRTNRQIRSEARGIFYKENRAEFSVLNYDIRKIVTWLDLSPIHHSLYANAQLELSVTDQYTICWYNLHNWVYMYRKGRCARLTYRSSFCERITYAVSVPTVGHAHIHSHLFDRDQAIELFRVAQKHLAAGSDSHTTHVALERYRTHHMMPHPTTHRIWWNSPDPPAPAPPPPQAYSFFVSFNYGPPMGPTPTPQYPPTGFPSMPPAQFHMGPPGPRTFFAGR
jgi:hypothetical protein